MPKNKYFKDEAKIMVDMLFESKILIETVTRDDMNHIEEFILNMLQSRFDMHLRSEALFKKIKEDKRRKDEESTT